jgi:small nuclear ribonucleoprotein (snRNP)-like protein
MTNFIHYSLRSVEIFSIAFVGLWLVALLIASIRKFFLHESLADSPWTLSNEEKAQLEVSKEGRLCRILVAFDIFMNVLLFNGQEDETISAHSWRASLQGKLWGKVMVTWLNLFQSDHGYNAAAGDLERAEEREATEKRNLNLK